MTRFCFHLEEYSFIADNMSMLETFDIDEIPFEKEDMLSIQSNCFYSIEIICAFIITFFYNSMSSLTNFIA